MSNPGTPASNVIVPVVSATLSKVNWIAGATALASTLNELLPLAPPKYQHYISAAIAIIGGVATIYARTFLSSSITPSSAAASSQVTDLATHEQAAVQAGINLAVSGQAVTQVTDSGALVAKPVTADTAKEIIATFGPGTPERDTKDLNLDSLAAAKGTSTP